MNRKRLQIMILLIIPIFVHAQHLLTIEELFEKGIENSIQIQSSEIRLSITEDQLALSKNKRLPDLQLSGAFGYVGTSSILDTDLSFLKHTEAPDWKQNYQITATQPLYQGGKIKRSIERNEIQKQIATLSLQKDKSDLKLWMISKYLDLYNLHGQTETYKQNIIEAEKRLKDIRKMREEGMITSNDVLRSEIELKNYELALQQAENNLILVSQELSIIMALDETLIYAPDSTFLTKKQALSPLDVYINEAYSDYLGIKINNKNLDLARNNLQLAKADFLPTLSLQFGNSFIRPVPNTSPVSDKYINSWGITLNLSYHLSNLYDRKHSIALAKKQIDLQEWILEQDKQDIRVNVKTAYLRHLEAIQRVEVLENTLNMTKENYRIVNKKYFNQLSILTDLLDANTLQLNATLELTAAKANMIYTYYQLLNITGKL